MNEQGRHQDNGRGFDGSNIPLLYTVILYFDSAPIVLLFLFPTNPESIHGQKFKTLRPCYCEGSVISQKC